MVKLILVNKKNRKIGLEEKKKAHLGKGMLHRAFTVFIFNSKKELLIQKRSKNKFLWPLIWETSCSSHLLPEENFITAGKKRLEKELGFICGLKSLGRFQYQADYKNTGAENEICSLLIGRHDGEIKPNKKEVAEYKWVDIKELKKDLRENPGRYAPWLRIALKYYENRK
ncbi:MAG: isopentenyl-diphosphate Delta-isomerase [Candidatus Nealsonbacteria bacterium]|nr:isopentenyl-diphosphate Delta-isomerase [Candidatus Nealsonbacteria bacterium]